MLYQLKTVRKHMVTAQLGEYGRVLHSTDVKICSMPFQVFAALCTALRDEVTVTACHFHSLSCGKGDLHELSAHAGVGDRMSMIIDLSLDVHGLHLDASRGGVKVLRVRYPASGCLN